MSYQIRLFMQGFVLMFSYLFLNTAIATAAIDDTTPAYLATVNMSLGEKNYLKLHDTLPIYQNAVMHPWPVLSSNKLLKKGMRSSIVPLLRERLGATNELPLAYDRSDLIYDAELVEAVKGFQQRNGLKNDGIIGKDTLQELNVTPEVRVKQIQINMQRWASLSPQLGNRFIMVNIPDYRLYVYEDNQEILTMKAIVGKPTSPTPELRSQVIRVVFNPPWNIPVKIAQKEMVKKVIEDPSYLDANHIKIYESQESNAMAINQDEVDWYAARVNGFPYHLRQDPGDDNSLGLVKFEFQNSADVYLHDTPAKELFNQDVRALSHGCVRLENAFSLVDYLMRDDPEWTEDRMQEILMDGKTKYIKAYHSIPILITYITAWVDDNGTVNFRDDVYGKDN